jgi:hypothetical protein
MGLRRTKIFFLKKNPCNERTLFMQAWVRLDLLGAKFFVSQNVRSHDGYQKIRLFV